MVLEGKLDEADQTIELQDPAEGGNDRESDFEDDLLNADKENDAGNGAGDGGDDAAQVRPVLLPLCMMQGCLI